MGLVRLNGQGGKFLREPTAPVDDIAQQVLPYIDEAKRIIEREQGVGLAAPQMGLPYKWYMDQLFMVYINPEISEDPEAELINVFEGCLSIPERWYSTKRVSHIDLTFTDITGTQQILELSGVRERVAQHECDHLSGTMISDHGQRVYKGDER
jgi:peptide deformylase